MLLLLAMIGANYSRLFVYAGFERNKSFIIKELCENRNTPEMKCEGKCFLKKGLAAAEEKEKKQEKDTRIKASVDIFLVNKPFVFTFIRSLTQRKEPALLIFELSEFKNKILRPPSSQTVLI